MEIQAHKFTARTKIIRQWPQRIVLTLEYPLEDAYHARVVALISEFMTLEGRERDASPSLLASTPDDPPSTEPQAPAE